MGTEKIQYIITAVVIALAIAYSCYRIYKSMTDKNDPCHGCEGCDIKKLCKRQAGKSNH